MQYNIRFDKSPVQADVSDVIEKNATVQPFKTQLLKWVGNKQRFAHEIISHFPPQFRAYHEPFLGSGGVLGVLAPARGYGSDVFGPLMEIWLALQHDPETLIGWYTVRWEQMQRGDKVTAYERIKASYNARPNGADFVLLSRACYGGVVRFRRDGYMSTPCGVHQPIAPASFAERVALWRQRVGGTEFACCDFTEAMRRAAPGDLIYCDPPYSYTQTILYGAQQFSLRTLFEVIADCKQRGVAVALSIDGSKKSGERVCDIPLPAGVFVREVAVNCGRSMLRRFQMEGRSLETEGVTDRLLLTY